MILFIDTYGTYLHVKDDMFEVRLKKDNDTIRKKIAPLKINSILLSNGITISTDAINLALRYNIDILFMEFDGTPYGRVWFSKLGSTTKIRKQQLITSVTNKAIMYVKKWITLKLQNQIDLLKKLKKHRMDKAPLFTNVINKLKDRIELINKLEGRTISDIADNIRGFEGSAAKEYFRLLGIIIPDNYKFETRNFRPAKDAFNAFLNYAYGVLYGKTEKALIIAGIDPFVGFLHRDDYNQKSMVFDFIEPFRIYADEVVFKLFSSKKISKKHTDKIANGVSLNKEGKMLLMQSFNDFMDIETLKYRGKNQTRNNIIQLEAHAFASSLLKKKFNQEETDYYDLLGDV